MISEKQPYSRPITEKKLLKLSINAGLFNKYPTANEIAYKEGFEPIDVTLSELADTIKSGAAFSYRFRDGILDYKHFQETDVLCVDFDGGMTIQEALNDRVVKCYGSLLYTTASHSPDMDRFRIVFVLPRTITKSRELKIACASLTRRITGDMKPKKIEQTFFGSFECKDLLMLGNSITNAFLSSLINDHDIELRKESYGQDDVTTNRSRQVWLKSKKVKLANGSVIKLGSIKNGTSIRCPVHKDNRYAAFAGFNDNNKMYVRCPVCRKVWWIESGGPTYGFDDFDKVLSSLEQGASGLNPNGNEGKLFHGGVISLNATINKIEFQSERYLKIDKLANGLTFIKSPKGTGKTHFLETEVKRYGERFGSLEEYEIATDDEEKQVHANRSVLLIGHRRALIKNICTRLGLNCYLDDKTEPDGRERREQEIYARKKRYGVCLDSISKVRDHHYDMVVIDESEQVLQHFLSETIGSKRTECFEIFSEILRNASRVILLDADLGWTTYKTIRSIYSPKQQNQTKPKTTPSATFYVNRWVSENRSICIHSKQESLEERLIADIVDGKRVFVTSNSRGLISALDQKLDKLKKADNSKIVKIVVTSKNSKSKKSQKFINDISAEILNN